MMHSFTTYFFYHCRQCVFSVSLMIVALYLSNISVSLALQVPNITTLKNRSQLDDYYSNVVLGYNIVNDTQTYARRFVGNKLNCTNCHREAGTLPWQLPLNVAGIYPLWRSKNAQMTDLTLMIRECFVYSHNGVMPPANAPEVIAIKTYINYLSINQVIGQSPRGRGISTLPETIYEPNSVNGQIVYQQQCTTCHGDDGQGHNKYSPIWGIQSYTSGSAMNNVPLAAGFLKTKMSQMTNSNLSVQQAFDVAAYLNIQTRPVDAGKRKLPKFLQDIFSFFK